MDSIIDPRALFTLNYGVYIVSTEYQGRKNGQIINALMQLTANLAQAEAVAVDIKRGTKLLRLSLEME